MKRRDINSDQFKLWFSQLCFAMEFIHDAKIIHRDLRTDSIFIDKNNNIKIADFGIALELVEHEISQDIRTI